MKPQARKAAADYARGEFAVSKRRACGLMTVAASSYYYRPCKGRDDVPLREALRRHAAERRRWGYRRLTVLLRRDGYTDNHKRIHRLYREEGLQVRQRRRRKQRLPRGTARPESSTAPNQRWSLDFVHDRLVNGRSLRMLTIVDDYTRECLWIETDTSLSAIALSACSTGWSNCAGVHKVCSPTTARSLPGSPWTAGRMNGR